MIRWNDGQGNITEDYDNPPRTYTEQEMQLERAAIVREAAKRRCEWCARGLRLMSEVYSGGSPYIHESSGEPDSFHYIGQHVCDAPDILSLNRTYPRARLGEGAK